MIMCSDTSPRISFSHDIITQPETQSPRRDTMLLESSNLDFEFNIIGNSDHEPSSADELFANGMILPAIRANHVQNPPKPKIPHPISIPPDNSGEKIGEEEKPPQKSFWGFKRSSSLNCDIKRSLICSLPLLSRSNSTGSVPNPKRCPNPMKEAQKQSSVSKNGYLKPPLKKNYGGGGAYGNGVRISPVFNVPPPYIAKGTTNLFGFGSFLLNGKDKKNKK